MPPKRRRRFQGLYYHSSPPKVIPMNAQIVNGRKRRETDDFSVKLSTIRIWMHEKDIGKLTRLLWAGQGHRLSQQASTNSKVKRFLAAVPYVMNSVKDVHQAVIDNSLETLQSKVEPPVPPSLITCKDANGLNIVHKAAGLGHAMILEYLIGVWPDGINETDITGKTPLHWAASAKNNMRCYTLLTQAGADEEALDYKMRTPSYYRHKPHEIERAFLVYLPEAPRVSPGVSTDWEALAEDGADGRKLDIKIPDANGFENDVTVDNEISQDDVSDADLNDGKNNIELEPDVESIKENGNTESENVPDESEHNEDKLEVTEEEEEGGDQNNSGKGRDSGSGSGRGGGRSSNGGGRGSLNDEDINNENEEEMESENIHNGHSSNAEEDEVDKDVIQDIEISGEEEEKENEEEQKPEILDEQHDDDNVKDEENNEEQPNTEILAEENNENDDVVSNEENVIENDNVKSKVDDDDVNDQNTEENEESDTKLENSNGFDNKNQEISNNIVSDDDNEEQNIENLDENELNNLENDNNDEKDEHNDNDHNETDKTENSDTEIPQENEEDKNINENHFDNEDIITNENKLNTDDITTENENNILDINNIDAENNVIPKDEENNTDEDENVLQIVENDNNATKKHKSTNDAEEDDDEDVVVPNTANKFDVNHNEQKSTTITNGDIDGDGNDGIGEADSHTSSLAIEGFVHGDSEDNTVQSQSAALLDEEPNIQEIIATGDMEQLAQIVLNGDGGKLLNLESTESDIQAFLNNVPNYMSKIRRVHEAARTGSLLALQQALDRRKFAIAKDEISPGGATPLHVAVLFGHTDIVRYLAARFSETNTVTDNDGRTALHYAATIRDNGHFYNLLSQLGANPRLPDNLGYTPEFYTDMDKAKDILTYNKLLRNFGAEELEEELLTDQVPDDLHSSRRLVNDADIQRTLDRCFSVIQDSSKVLSGVTASALAQRKPLSASSLQLSVTSYLSRFLKRSIYDKIKKRQTRLDHNLFDVIWPAMRKTSKIRHLEEDINCGIIAPDFDIFVVFSEFLVPLLKDMHCLSLTADFKPHPRIAYFPMENGIRLNTADFVFDDESKLIQCCKVECSRNLEEFELPLNLTVGQIEQAERLIMGRLFTADFTEAIGETESGSYYTLTEILEQNSEVLELLTSLGLMIPLLETTDTVQEAESMAFNGTLWSYGRGVYLSANRTLALWINCQEHLRVISTTSSDNSANLGSAYTRVGRAVSYLEVQLHFKESYLLGYLQSRPAYLGTGLKFFTTIKLPNLMKEMDNLRHLCSVRGLSLITEPIRNINVRVVNMQSLGTVEYILFQDYCTAVTNILSLEKDMSLTNSKHIANMLVKIFRRKKNSLVDRN